MAAPVIVKIAPQHEHPARKSGLTPSKFPRLDSGCHVMVAQGIIALLGLGTLALWARLAHYPMLHLACTAATGTATAYAIVALRAVLS